MAVTEVDEEKALARDQTIKKNLQLLFLLGVFVLLTCISALSLSEIATRINLAASIDTEIQDTITKSDQALIAEQGARFINYQKQSEWEAQQAKTGVQKQPLLVPPPPPVLAELPPPQNAAPKAKSPSSPAENSESTDAPRSAENKQFTDIQQQLSDLEDEIGTVSKNLQGNINTLSNNMLNIYNQIRGEAEAKDLRETRLGQLYAAKIILKSVDAFGALLVAGFRKKELTTIQDLCLGISAGFITYLAIRGGRHFFVLDHPFSGPVLNPFGSAFSGLVAGLFTEKAYQFTTKLFDNAINRINSATK